MERKLPAFFVIPEPIMDATLVASKKLNNSGIFWAVGGDLGEAFRAVEVTPKDVEIITDKEGAEAMHSLFSEFKPTELKLVERRESRDAKVEGKELPLHSQGYFFEFMIGEVPVRVHGDLKFKVGEWEWGDALEFEPEIINLVGTRIPVVPIVIRRDLYKSLGWYDRMRLIAEALSRQQFGEYGMDV
jgi:hypothetical protein